MTPGRARGQPSLADAAKLGILVGSLLSGLAGYLLLRTAPPVVPSPPAEPAANGRRPPPAADVRAIDVSMT